MKISANEAIKIQAQADAVIKVARQTGEDEGADFQQFMPYNEVKAALEHAMKGLISDQAVALALDSSDIQDALDNLLFGAFERAKVIETIIEGE